MDAAKSTSSIQVIDRLSTLLDAIAANKGGASLKLLSAVTGLHPSTAFRILSSAVHNGLIARDAAGHYGMGPQWRDWGRLLETPEDIRVVARPIMEWLRDKVEETVNLTLREGDEVVYVERATPKRMMRVEQVIGSHAPLHVTAVGKLMLGLSGKEAIQEYALRTGLPAYTPNTLTTKTKLYKAAAQCVKQGYALDNEEAEIGVGCIGILIHDSAGQWLAGLSISAPIERRREAWVPLIQEASRRISQKIKGPLVSPAGPLDES